MAVPNQAFRII